MAVRSGAGTGVVVALVVFVMTTVLLLVLTIVFYRGQTQAKQSEAEAQASLAKYVKPAQRNQDSIATIEAAAAAANQSVAEYMLKRNQDLMAVAHGSAQASHDQFVAAIEGLGADQSNSLLDVARRLQSQVRASTTSIESKDRRLAEADEQVAALEDEMDALRDSHEQSIAQLNNQFDAYGSSVEEYNDQLASQIELMRQSVESLKLAKDSEIEASAIERDDLLVRINTMQGQLTAYREAQRDSRPGPQNPATLVDGRIIETSSGDEVFIDRGSQDRIVLGMTFEVYSDASAIMDPATRRIYEGKASIQVTRVGEKTSTCKITNMVRGRPIVRDDVIANAVYDPSYVFSFQIHGHFDINGDNIPTPKEADYLRGLVTDWGGKIVTGDDLPGDLDFLVLGTEPPDVPQPSGNASDIQVREWIRKKKARESYVKLRDQAREAQIPILNANRFLILIGYADR